jgi:hypothetical protein
VRSSRVLAERLGYLPLLWSIERQRQRLVEAGLATGTEISQHLADIETGRLDLASFPSSPPGAASPGNRRPDPEPVLRLPPPNLKTLRRPSGNLRLSRGLPLARLKVRSRLSERNEGTKPPAGRH